MTARLVIRSRTYGLVADCSPHLEFSPVRHFAHNDVALRVHGNAVRVCQIARLVTRPSEFRENFSRDPVQDVNHIIGAVGDINECLRGIW